MSRRPGKPLGLNPKLRIEKAHNKELTDQLDKLKKQVEAEKNAQQQAATKLENERDSSKQERKQLETSLADLEKAKRDAVAAMNATQKNATDYRQQLDKLRTDILQSQQDRDAHFKKVVELTDQLNEAANEKEQLRKRMADLSKDLAKAREALRYFDINENADYKAKAPPRVDGRGDRRAGTRPGRNLAGLRHGNPQGTPARGLPRRRRAEHLRRPRRGGPNQPRQVGLQGRSEVPKQQRHGG